MRVNIFLFVCLMLSCPVWAQCAGPSLGNGNPGCSIPIDDPSSPYYTPNNELPAPPPQPLGEWIKTWGAVAQASSDGSEGVAVGKLTKKEAEDEAVRQCAIGGGLGCKPTFTYRNKCIALAQGDKSGANTVASISTERASLLARDHCVEAGGTNCKVYYTACTEPIFRHY